MIFDTDLAPKTHPCTQGEKRRIAELEGQIKAAQLKVLEQKQKTGGVNASKENGALIAKQIHLLENRLDKELVKFNQALAEVRTCGWFMRSMHARVHASSLRPPNLLFT